MAKTDPSEAVTAAAPESAGGQPSLPNVDTSAQADATRAAQAEAAATGEQDEDVGDDIYRVKVEGFEGPLDLLLHLIRKHELDILDIPISFITSKYLQYLDLMKSLQIDVASEYLVMAATLAWIKSKTLLPPDPSEEGDEEGELEEVDPRQELVRRLLEYQKYKGAAADFRHRATLAMDTFGRGTSEPVPEGPAPLAAVSMFRLFDAFDKVLKRSNQTTDHQVLFEKMSITERVVELTELLHKRRRMRFEQLFLRPDPNQLYSAPSRGELILTFLALLEMCKMRIARVVQHDSLGDLSVELASKHLGPEDEALLVEESAELSEEVASPDDQAAGPGEESAASGEEMASPGEEIAQPGEEVASPDEEIAQPGEEVASPDEEIAQSSEEIAQSSEEIASSGEEVAQPVEDGAEPEAHLFRAAAHRHFCKVSVFLRQHAFRRAAHTRFQQYSPLPAPAAESVAAATPSEPPAAESVAAEPTLPDPTPSDPPAAETPAYEAMVAFRRNAHLRLRSMVAPSAEPLNPSPLSAENAASVSDLSIDRGAPTPVMAEATPDLSIDRDAPAPVMAEVPDLSIDRDAPTPVMAEATPDLSIDRDAPTPVMAEATPDLSIDRDAPAPVMAEASSEITNEPRSDTSPEHLFRRAARTRLRHSALLQARRVFRGAAHTQLSAAPAADVPAAPDVP